MNRLIYVSCSITFFILTPQTPLPIPSPPPSHHPIPIPSPQPLPLLSNIPRIPHLPLKLLQRPQLTTHKQATDKPVHDARAEPEGAEQEEEERDEGARGVPYRDETADGNEDGEAEVGEAEKALVPLAGSVSGDQGEDLGVG